MSSNVPKRIQLHRLKFHWLGKKTDMLSFFSLDPDEKKMVAEDILTKLHLNRGKDPYKVYVETLADWGIVCPHPEHMRLYSGVKKSEYPVFDHKWFKCEVCGCSSFNENFLSSQRVG